MRSPIAIANIEQLEATRFVVVVLFDEYSYVRDRVLYPVKAEVEAIDKIADIAAEHGLYPLDVWTSTKELYAESLKYAGLNVQFKHESDTSVTKRMLDDEGNILRDLYKIEPLTPKPKPSKLRAFIVGMLQKILDKVRGDFDYA